MSFKKWGDGRSKPESVSEEKEFVVYHPPEVEAEIYPPEQSEE